MTLTPKAAEALRLLEGTSPRDTRSAKALASMLWPEKLKSCGTSLRRSGLYRAAGAYYSKLQRFATVAVSTSWVTGFSASAGPSSRGVSLWSAAYQRTGGALDDRLRQRLLHHASGGSGLDL